ncbi:MAG: hypothetical protein KAV42_02605 [Candidatus Krumholzibacteria bacterium]|nr:hypothetical protein [Candidatus Krumholzibacteria bacterium]
MRNSKRMWISVSMILTVVLAAMFLSCSEVWKKTRSGGTIIIGETSDYESLNPMQTTDAHARDIYNQLFLLLMDENPDLLTFSPRLAESYEFSGDRKKLTFHLRKDASWSDGVGITSRDVLATFSVQKDTTVVWASIHLKDHIDSVTAPDDYTVVYHFNHVYPYQVMDAVDGPILPAHFLEKHPGVSIKSVPIEEFPVSGPFKVKEWVKGQSLTLVPNESYYDSDKPYLDKVIFKIVPDQVTINTQLKSGEIDGMEIYSPSEVEALRTEHPELTVHQYQGRNYVYIGWNGGRKPFDNMNVRRALSHAIDRQKIIDNLYYGLAKECVGPFPPIIWAHDPDIEPIVCDPAIAREILAAEGYLDSDGDGYLEKDGMTFEFELLTNQGNQTRADIQVMVQEALREIGVKVIPVTMEWTVMLSRHKASDFDGLISAWRASTKADLYPIWGCDARAEGYNRIDYCNPLVDSLNTAATSILDFDEARPIFNRAERIIYEEQPYTFLYVPSGILVLNSRIRGARPDAISSIHNIHEWYVEGDGPGH